MWNNLNNLGKFVLYPCTYIFLAESKKRDLGASENSKKQEMFL